MNTVILQFKKITPLCLICLALGSFALCQQMQAATDTPKPTDDVVPVSNTADGHLALASITTGIYNSAFGFYALLSLTDGNFCTAMGGAALLSNTGNQNTATGCSALLSNTTADNNTADGAFALILNTTGAGNTAVGNQALFSNIGGSRNTAVGSFALAACIAPEFFASNTAVGASALLDDTTGTENTAIGDSGLFSNTTGAANTAIGSAALVFNTEGSNNTAVGKNAGSAVVAANNVICIGASVAGADVSDTCFIGNIRGVTTQNADAMPVLVDSAGQLGTTSSSARFKKDIKSMDKASEAILAFRPVTFHYKTDKKSTPQFGLIAEDVAEVNPDLVVRDKSGEVYTVRYDAVNAMLLNEFLKEHRKNEEQQATIAQLKSGMEALTATVKEQAAQIQKVSAQVEASKAAPQVVNNP